VSKIEQTFYGQKRYIENCCDIKFPKKAVEYFTDKVSGSKKDQNEFDALKKQLRAKDTAVVHHLN
jgi:DNA invertase Pin-like site-specific DNA recombinase